MMTIGGSSSLNKFADDAKYGSDKDDTKEDVKENRTYFSFCTISSWQ